MLRIVHAYSVFAALMLTAAPAQAQFTKLFDFNDPTSGRIPKGALVSDGTWLCGAGSAGGTTNCGTIVRVKLDGSDPTILHSFEFATSGCYPESRLFIEDDYLYGTTKGGGTIGMGTIFRMHLDGTGFEKLLDLTDTNGANPTAGVISDGTWLYGTTSAGGQLTFGAVFRIMPDGSGHQLLFQFNGTNGREPRAELLLVGDTLYGTTSIGGPEAWGTVFKMHKDGSGHTLLHAFGDLADGRFPDDALYAIGDQLYGIARVGGSLFGGLIYRIGMDGTGFTEVLEFDPFSTGVNVQCSFIYDGTWFYGSGSLSNPDSPVTGTLFRVKPDGTDFTTLYGLTEEEGKSPMDQVLLVGGSLYSAASLGGINGDGTIFRFNGLPTSIAAEPAAQGWSLYPNPANTTITLHWNHPAPHGTLELRDAQGRNVLTRNTTGNPDVLVDLSCLSAGIYAVVVRDENGVATQRFVKD